MKAFSRYCHIDRRETIRASGKNERARGDSVAPARGHTRDRASRSPGLRTARALAFFDGSAGPGQSATTEELKCQGRGPAEPCFDREFATSGTQSPLSLEFVPLDSLLLDPSNA